jgi:hypothetical protein
MGGRGDAATAMHHEAEKDASAAAEAQSIASVPFSFLKASEPWPSITPTPAGQPT